MLAAILPLLNMLLPMVGAVGGPTVAAFLPFIDQAATLAVQEGPAIVAGVQQFIADLSATGDASAEELAALQASSAKLDAAFEAAASAAGDPSPRA